MYARTAIAFMALMAALAVSSPVDLPDTNGLPLEKRSGPGVHLSNCQGVRGTTLSAIVYYPDDSAASSGTYPGDNNVASVSSPSYNTDYVHWEGQSVSAKFSTGVTFTSNIQSNGNTKSTGTKVGTGYNGSNWSCYKDNGHQLFSTSSLTCESIYYCLQG